MGFKKDSFNKFLVEMSICNACAAQTMDGAEVLVGEAGQAAAVLQQHVAAHVVSAVVVRHLAAVVHLLQQHKYYTPAACSDSHPI